MKRAFVPSRFIPLFDQKPIIPPSRSPCPAAAARSGGQGRPSGRRGFRASPLTAASTVAGIGRVGAAVVAVVILGLSLAGFSSSTVARDLPSGGDVDALDPLAGILAEASRRFGLPQSWLRAVIDAESGGDARALSPKGAMGLMQVMPDTFAEMRARYNLGADPFDPATNILAGAAYLREMFDRFGAAGFLAAYNAGPARYADHLATGRPLPDETVAYVARLAPLLAGVPLDSRSAAPSSPFIMRFDGTSLAFRPQGEGLFVSLRPVGAR